MKTQENSISSKNIGGIGCFYRSYGKYTGMRAKPDQAHKQLSFVHSQKEKIRWFDMSQAHDLCVITKENTWLEQISPYSEKKGAETAYLNFR